MFNFKAIRRQISRAIVVISCTILATVIGFLEAILSFAKFMEKVFTSRIMRIVIAFTFFRLENNYFGWNKLPQSPEEVIADGIFLLLLMLAFFPMGNTKVVVNYNNKENK